MEKRRTVLIVDDQKLNREILEDILKQDYNILMAEDGVEALKIIKERYDDISAILLDIIMPNMDGYQVLEAIAKENYDRKIPIIVITQSDGLESELKALTKGAMDFITKPFVNEVVAHRLRNLVELNEANKMIGWVQKDYVTGVYTKEAFFKKVESILAENSEDEYDIVAIDMEGFKLVNDAYGMAEGNHLLVYMGDRLQKMSKKLEGFVARFSGDIFLMLSKRQDGYIQNMINESIESMREYPLEVKPTLKFGIYEIEDTKVPVNSMCDRAILAVNQIKGKYNINYKYYEDSIRKKLLQDYKILGEMKNAIKEEQFEIYFQPKYDLRNEKIAGAEALIRWNHPDLGFLFPVDFIPLFEKNGFINELDKYVWKETAKTVREWKEEGVIDIPVSVNVSRKDIAKDGLVDDLKKIVSENNLTTKDLHLEITETAYTDNSQQLIEVVSNLKKEGFIIEMDDFGSGYSSLNMLADLPLDVLKVDMRFLQSDNKKKEVWHIMKFIMGLAKELNLLVTTEGVDKVEHIELLKSLDCNYAQGYFYAKPMPREQFEQLFKKNIVH